MNRRRQALLLGGGRKKPFWLQPQFGFVAVYIPIRAASLALSYVNLANPGTNDAFPGVAPTWNATDGWVFNATSYLRTGIIPVSGCSAMIRFTGATAEDDDVLFGQFSSGASVGIAVNRAAVGVRYFNGLNLDKAGGVSAGNLAVAGTSAYRNGVAETGTIPAWSGTAVNEIIIGGSTATAKRAGNVQALLLSNITWTPSQVATLKMYCDALPN